jgi:hypothetical protein
LLKVGPGKTKKILEKSLKSHGIFSQKKCMNPVIKIGSPGENAKNIKKKSPINDFKTKMIS